MNDLFKLSWEGQGHTADVRGVTSWGDHVVSCSRDKTARIWKPIEVQTDSGTKVIYESSCVLEAHSGFVNAVCAFGLPEGGFIVTGSQDKTALVWQKQPSAELSQETVTVRSVLSGHSETVCSVSVSSDGSLIVTGSWDKTAKVWESESGTCVATLSGHDASVWAAVSLQDGNFATASADSHVRIFQKNGSCIQKLSSHKDAVRSLCLMGGHVISSANDGDVKVWGDGSLLQSVSEFEGFPVYNVASNSNQIAASSEDKNLKIFSRTDEGLKLDQSLAHPCVIWCGWWLPNGDLASAGSDGVLRVWSNAEERVAEPDVQEAFQLRLSSQTISSQMVGQIDKTQLRGVEAIAEPGDRPDQRRIINNGGVVEIYQWMAGERVWTKIGDVVDSKGGNSKQTLNGVSFDFVFDVDVQEGMPPLKIGVNRGDDPWMVAQQFLIDHELPQDFLSQVADFLVRNVGADSLSTTPVTAGDPLTGGSRYIPGSAARRPAPPPSVGMAVDPLSGSGAYRSGGAPPAKSRFFPETVHSVYDAGNIAGMQKKLVEFNQQLQGSGNELEEGDMSHILEVIDAISTPQKSLTPDQLGAVFLLLAWPDKFMLPVVDLTRLLVRHKDGASLVLGDDGEARFLHVMTFANKDKSAPQRMLSMRFLCNLFTNVHARPLLVAHMNQVLEAVQDCHEMTQQNPRSAYISLLVNYCVELGRSQGVKFESKVELVGQLTKTLKSETDQDSRVKLCKGIGTLALHDRTLREAIKGEAAVMEQINLLATTSLGDPMLCATELKAIIEKNF